MPPVERLAPVPTRDHTPPDGGVTVVIGLILAAGLVAALLVNYQLQWVPTAMEDHQAQHMSRVQQELSGLVATLDKQLLGEVNTTVSTSVGLGTPGKGFPSMAPIAHSLTFEAASPTGHNLTVNASTARIFEKNERSLGGLDERFVPVPGTNASIRDTAHARAKIATIDEPGTTGPSFAKETLNVQITNGTGVPTGRFTLVVDEWPRRNDGRFSVNVTVRDTDENGPLIAQDRRILEGPISPYFVDLLNPSYQFDALLEDAATPYRVTWSSSGLDASYSMTYDEIIDGETITRIGGGREDVSFESRLPSGTLTYEGDNPQFVDQRYIVENGALLLDQSDGTTFITKPRFTANHLDETVVLSVTFPRLKVPNSQMAGVTDITLKTTTLETASFRSASPDLNLTVNTDQPEAWNRFFTDLMKNNDVPSSAYSVVSDASTATLEIPGPRTDGSEDVQLTLRHTLIRAEVLR